MPENTIFASFPETAVAEKPNILNNLAEELARHSTLTESDQVSSPDELAKLHDLLSEVKEQIRHQLLDFGTHGMEPTAQPIDEIELFVSLGVLRKHSDKIIAKLHDDCRCGDDSKLHQAIEQVVDSHNRDLGLVDFSLPGTKKDPNSTWNQIRDTLSLKHNIIIRPTNLKD